MNYVGITGIKTPEEVSALDAHYSTLGADYGLHLGVMTGRKKLQGLPTKYAQSFLDREQLSALFPRGRLQTMWTLHYADYGKDEDGLGLYTLWQAIIATKNIQAVQLDMVLPHFSYIDGTKRMFPHLELILQLNPESFLQTGSTVENPSNLLKRLEADYKAIDYVLLDFSKGRGKPMDAEAFAPLAATFAKYYKVAVAGGLGPDTLDKLGPLKGLYSIDAQGALIQEGRDPLDPLVDLDKCKKYLQKSVDLSPKPFKV